MIRIICGVRLVDKVSSGVLCERMCAVVKTEGMLQSGLKREDADDRKRWHVQIKMKIDNHNLQGEMTLKQTVLFWLLLLLLHITPKCEWSSVTLSPLTHTVCFVKYMMKRMHSYLKLMKLSSIASLKNSQLTKVNITKSHTWF